MNSIPEIERLCLEMDVIARKYGFFFVDKIKLIGKEYCELSYDRKITKDNIPNSYHDKK